MLSATKLAITYGIFALIATAVNISAQEFVGFVYTGNFNFFLSLTIGTGLGLVVKYILDKRYIFRFHARNRAHHSQIFVLYIIMGLVTTLFFWGFEYSFNAFFATKKMRYLGGIIGLGIGYLIKYQLDKRFVFKTASS